MQGLAFTTARTGTDHHTFFTIQENYGTQIFFNNNQQQHCNGGGRRGRAPVPCYENKSGG